MSRTWYGLIIVAALIVEFATTPQLGFVLGCDGGNCHVRAGASLVSIIVPLLLAAFVWLCPRARDPARDTDYVTIWERSAGAMIGTVILIWSITPFATLLILYQETVATGVFQWHFAREFLRGGDGLTVLWVASAYAGAVFGYFYGHALLGRQTVGQYLLRNRTEGIANGVQRPAFALNTVLGIVGYCVWPVSIFLAANRDDKAFWWNLCTRTSVVRAG